MDEIEFLILEYDLREWMNPVYTGGDRIKQCEFAKKDEYCGLLRVGSANNVDLTDEPEDKLAQ